ncbi:MAG: methionyl-tRNA formyltransferase [Sedimentisphaerales bacterium]|nr:methionyl-tRNA formyltransferase [Sedimentisphaerales bacterium]MBN2843289.1 methionyl-tRNA formyltransferase [Sedimentisphaerales bacterium]
MKIIFMGGGDFGCDTLRWLASSHHQILKVFTQPARPAGRGRSTTPTPIAALSNKLGLECLETANINSPENLEIIRQLVPDVIVVIAFGQWLGSALQKLPAKIINLHSSLLPKYRGAAPINWAIIQGEKITGVTVIEINDIWDGGGILASESLEIGETETAGELHDRLAALGPALIAEVLGEFEAGIYNPQKQNDCLACKAPKMQKSDGKIDFSRPAAEIKCKILGMWPWPGAFCFLQQEGSEPLRLSLCRCQLVNKAPSDLSPGSLDSQLDIVCGDGLALRLLEVKPDNSKLMTFKDFANGKRLKSGDIFC